MAKQMLTYFLNFVFYNIVIWFYSDKYIYIDSNRYLFILDIIDIVRDPVTGADYCKEEDPCLYVSEKTKRGPLSEDWIETYWNEVRLIILFQLLQLRIIT